MTDLLNPEDEEALKRPNRDDYTRRVEESLLRARMGSSEAWGFLNRHYGRTIFAACRRLCANAKDAEDLTHEVISDAYVHRASLPTTESDAAGWFGRRSKWRALDALRKSRRFVPLDVSKVGHEQSVFNDPATKSDAARVHREILRLPRPLAKIAWLYLVEDMSRLEIARALGLRGSTVGNLVRKALGTLRERLREQP